MLDIVRHCSILLDIVRHCSTLFYFGNKIEQCSCIIHYDFITTSDQLIKVSQASLKTLTESKEIRESLGQENHHEEQCNGIPEALGERSLFYHRECYQKFFAKTILKRKRDQADDSSKCRKRLSREHGASDSKNSRGLLTKHCMICLKERIKVKGKFQLPTKIITKSAEETLKKAAVLKNDLAMLASVTDTDLIAKEFSKHEKYYLEYTRITREKSANTSTISEKSDNQGDFDAVCEVIEKRVLEEQQCLSMESIVSAYGINEGDRQQRYRLKTRLLQKYVDDLLFISYEKHSPQLVISKKCLETLTMSRVLGSSDSSTIKKAAVILCEAVKKTIDESEALPWPPTISLFMVFSTILNQGIRAGTHIQIIWKLP